MGQYSIKDIESLSGIKAHTLRIWEQRYDILVPHRTDTNIRYYSDEQLKMILNIALLNKNGYKISKIAAMDSEQIRDIILHLTDTSDTEGALLDSLLHSMIDFDEALFEKTLNLCITRMGFERAFQHLIIPFMARAGLLWCTSIIKPVQEHFISNLIKRKLAVAVDHHPVIRDTHTRRFVLFTPEGEWHELMLMYTDFLLRSHQHEVIYLGCSVPLEDIDSLGPLLNPDCLVCFITAPLQSIPLQQFIDHISAAYPHLKILLGGPQIASHLSTLTLPANVIHINDHDTFMNHIGAVAGMPTTF